MSRVTGKFRGLTSVFALIASLIVLAFGAQQAAAEKGVTDTEVRLGMWVPLSGPISLLGNSTRDAVNIWVKEINDKGGIAGRKLKLIAYDDAASPQEAQAAIRRLLNQDEVFMLIGGSASGSTLPVKPLILQEKVPFIASISSNMNLMRPFSRYIFRVYANEENQAIGLIDWMMQGENIKRPAIIYNSNDYGVGGYNAMKERLKSKYNLDLVAAERYNATDQDFTAQLLRIKAANPDGLLVFSFAAEAGIITRQAKELALTAKLFGGGGTATPLFQRGAGDAAKGFESVFTMPEMPETSQLPGMANYRERLKEMHSNALPPGRPSEYDMSAYGAAKITEAALRKVGRNLTREAFIDAVESLKNFDTTVTFPVTYSKESHEGTDKVTIIRVGDDLRWQVDPAFKAKQK
jgi:branched-chain amino acid transport system substrate-binding protein